MDDTSFTLETATTQPCEQLSDIISDLELKIKEYEKNTVPKYLNEVQELEDKLKVVECQKSNLAARLDKCLIEISDKDKMLRDKDYEHRTEIQTLHSELRSHNSKNEILVNDNRLLAREIERLGVFVRDTSITIENNNITVVNLEQENQKLKLQLREKQKESSNLKEQLSQMVDNNDKMRDALSRVDDLSDRVSKELEIRDTVKEQQESSRGKQIPPNGNINSKLDNLEVLFEKYSQLKLESRQSSMQGDTSSTKFYQSGNFEVENHNSFMKKVPSVPILNSKVIAQLKEAKERELNSLHSSVRLPDSKTRDSEGSQNEIFQHVVVTNLENRRLSNALSITSKQFNAANLEKRELAQELTELKSSLKYVVESKKLTEAQYESYISQLQSILAQNKVELNATIVRLEKEIEVKSKLADVIKQSEQKSNELATQISQLRQEASIERERSKDLLFSRDNLMKQLQRSQCVNQDLKLMVSQREERIKDLSVQRPFFAMNENEQYKKNLNISLQNFKKDIQSSLIVRDKLKKEHDLCFKGSIHRFASPMPNPKTISKLEMVQELKVRLDVIQKINSN
jgi:hypothetical protein